MRRVVFRNNKKNNHSWDRIKKKKNTNKTSDITQWSRVNAK
jgi:hypothetical protein